MELAIGILIGAAIGGLAVGVWAVRQRATARAAAERVGDHERLREELEAARRDLAVAAERIRRVEELEALRESLTAELQELRTRHASLAQSHEDERRHHEEKLALMEKAREELAHRFKVLSQEILEKQSQSFDQRQHERLDTILKPLSEKIQRFEKQVHDAYDKEGKERAGLLNEVKRLAEQSHRMSEEADSLARALKGQSKTRGDWGEVMLENLLQHAGLQKDIEYRTQANYTTGEGRRLQPDVVVELPDDKCLIIDSKVNLVDWIAANDAEEDDARTAAIARLGAGIRTHVADLGSKQYQTLEDARTVDFVLLFVPIEVAFASVMAADPTLYGDALDRNVVITSPTTLLATMRTIAMIWRYDRQERNAHKIAVEAGKMYDKLVSFCESFQEVGQRLDQAHAAWDTSRKRLRDGHGDLIGKAEKVRRMGARTSKKLRREWTEVEAGSETEPPSIEADAEGAEGAETDT